MAIEIKFHNTPYNNVDKAYIVMKKVPYDVIQKGKKVTKKVTYSFEHFKLICLWFLREKSIQITISIFETNKNMT